MTQMVIPAVGVDGFVEGDGVHDGVQGKDHVLPLDVQNFGDFLNAGLPLVLGDELLLGLEDFVGGVPHGAGDTDRATVTEVAANFPKDHGY